MDKNIVVIGGESSGDITRMPRIDEAERKQEGDRTIYRLNIRLTIFDQINLTLSA